MSHTDTREATENRKITLKARAIARKANAAHWKLFDIRTVEHYNKLYAMWTQVITMLEPIVGASGGVTTFKLGEMYEKRSHSSLAMHYITGEKDAELQLRGIQDYGQTIALWDKTCNRIGGKKSYLRVWRFILALHNYGLKHMKLDSFAQAEEFFRKGLKLQQELRDKSVNEWFNLVHWLNTHCWLAESLLKQKRFADAMACIQTALSAVDAVEATSQGVLEGYARLCNLKAAVLKAQNG